MHNLNKIRTINHRLCHVTLIKVNIYISFLVSATKGQTRKVFFLYKEGKGD